MSGGPGIRSSPVPRPPPHGGSPSRCGHRGPAAGRSWRGPSNGTYRRPAPPSASVFTTLWADRVSPPWSTLHGGGWTLFSLDTHDRLMRGTRRAGVTVVGVDYALAPEAKYPIALRQIAAAVRFLASCGEELAVDPQRLAIGGDSAAPISPSPPPGTARRRGAALPPRAAAQLRRLRPPSSPEGGPRPRRPRQHARRRKRWRASGATICATSGTPSTRSSARCSPSSAACHRRCWWSPRRICWPSRRRAAPPSGRNRRSRQAGLLPRRPRIRSSKRCRSRPGPIARSPSRRTGCERRSRSRREGCVPAWCSPIAGRASSRHRSGWCRRRPGSSRSSTGRSTMRRWTARARLDLDAIAARAAAPLPESGLSVDSIWSTAGRETGSTSFSSASHRSPAGRARRRRRPRPAHPQDGELLAAGGWVDTLVVLHQSLRRQPGKWILGLSGLLLLANILLGAITRLAEIRTMAAHPASRGDRARSGAALCLAPGSRPVGDGASGLSGRGRCAPRLRRATERLVGPASVEPPPLAQPSASPAAPGWPRRCASPSLAIRRRRSPASGSPSADSAWWAVRLRQPGELRRAYGRPGLRERGGRGEAWSITTLSRRTVRPSLPSTRCSRFIPAGWGWRAASVGVGRRRPLGLHAAVVLGLLLWSRRGGSPPGLTPALCLRKQK